MKVFYRSHSVIILLSVVIVLTLLLDDFLGDLLEYRRQAVMHGQFYRLLTAHLVHTNANHTFMNLAGLILISFISQNSLSQREWWFVTLISALSVGIGLLVFNLEVQWYRGLSGVLHGTMLVVILRATQLIKILRGLAVLALIGKIFLEQSQSGLWQSEQLISAPVIVDAHLYGLFGGAVSFVLLKIFRLQQRFQNRIS